MGFLSVASLGMFFLPSSRSTKREPFHRCHLEMMHFHDLLILGRSHSLQDIHKFARTVLFFIQSGDQLAGDLFSIKRASLSCETKFVLSSEFLRVRREVDRRSTLSDWQSHMRC